MGRHVVNIVFKTTSNYGKFAGSAGKFLTFMSHEKRALFWLKMKF